MQPSWCSGTRAVCALGRSGRRRLRAALSCPRPRPYPLSCPWGAGTNNQDLLQSPFYVGCKHERVRGDAYYELIDELMSAVKRRRAPRPPRRRRHGTAPSTCAGVDCWNPGRAASWDGGPCALLQRRRPSPARAGLATCASLAHVSCFSAATQTLRARRFGNTCLMHLEDMSFENLGRLGLLEPRPPQKSLSDERWPEAGCARLASACTQLGEQAGHARGGANPRVIVTAALHEGNMKAGAKCAAHMLRRTKLDPTKDTACRPTSQLRPGLSKTLQANIQTKPSRKWLVRARRA